MMTYRHMPDVPELDATRFLRLMDLMGPDTAPELLQRLESDLRAVAAGLQVGFRGSSPGHPDWEALRAHTHVLMSVAGTVGALRLQHQAEALNRQAHDQNPAGLAPVETAILAQLDRLIAYVIRFGQTGGAE